jgi:hypothetical protein
VKHPAGRHNRPRSRGIVTRLLIAGVLLYLACIVAVAVGPRVPGENGYYASPAWVRVCFWTGLGMMPLLFVLFAVRGFMWFFDSLSDARHRSAAARIAQDDGLPRA